jgi:hypothetical protein
VLFRSLVVGAIEELWHEQPGLPTSPATWAALVNHFHVAFGGQLAQRWKLPGVLGAVITSHHEPAATHGPLTRRVMVADRVVELLERLPEVRVADLEALGLERAAAETVAAVVPVIPPVLRAFEGTRESAPEPTQHELNVLVAGEAGWEALRVDERSVEVAVSEPLVPNLLIEATLQPPGFQFWALVERCESRDGRLVATLTPFALTPESARHWEALRSQFVERTG